MQNLIHIILAQAPGPQTARELLDSLKQNGHVLEEAQLTEELRKLQKENKVKIDRFHGRWKLLKPPGKNILGEDVPGEVTKQNNPLGATKIPAAPGLNPITPPTPKSRWQVFRQLCRYYTDCLIQGEAPDLRCYLDNENDTWLTVSSVPWGRIHEGGDFAQSVGLNQAAFQRNKSRRGSNEIVYLGYPLIRFTTKTGATFVVPIFVQPMKSDWSGGVLHLKPDGPVTVNGAWLGYRFRRHSERADFLTAMGLLEPLDDDSQVTPTAQKGFADLARDAASYLHEKDRFAQPVQPLMLDGVTDWQAAMPGLYNSAILTLGRRLKYNASLVRELRYISEKIPDEELDGTALTKLFPHEAPGNPEVIDEEGEEVSPASFDNEGLAQNRLLHTGQREAVLNGVTEPLSVITGPPGTGKSEVVVALLLNQLLRGRPTLFASKNHQAIEAVLPRLNNPESDGSLIIHASNKDQARSQNYLDKLKELLSRPSRQDAEIGQGYTTDLLNLVNQQAAVLNEIKNLDIARRDYGRLSHEFDDQLAKLPDNLRDEENILKWPENITSGHLKQLKTRLSDALRKPAGVFDRIWHWLNRQKKEQEAESARTPVMKLPNPFHDRDFPEPGDGIEEWSEFFDLWKEWSEAFSRMHSLRSHEEHIKGMRATGELLESLRTIQEQLEDLTGKWMDWASGGLPNRLAQADRSALQNLRAGIQTWGMDRFSKQLKSQFPLILKAFPLWAVSNLSAKRALPMAPGIFDLVVIDEASQCDIASVVPLLVRGKRAVFAGDPMQLQHVCNLDLIAEQTLLQRHSVSDPDLGRLYYKVNSAFDFASSSPELSETAKSSLDLHFRSHGLIADYINESFYNETLRVVTATEKLNVPAGATPGIHWTNVDGTPLSAGSGVWCAEEIEAISSHLKKLEESNYRGTVGVVTPFRAQANRLNDRLSSVLDPDFIEQIDFLASTAHGFQGDERDLILFSLCGGPGMPSGSLGFLGKDPNLFNVSASRARAVLHVFGNLNWAKNCGIKYIEKLAAKDGVGDEAGQAESKIYESPWEKVLGDALEKEGIPFSTQYPIAGRRLDLAIIKPIKVDIEVDGEAFHRTAGGGRKDDDHWRDLQLHSLGWKVKRFWVYELREDLDGCIEKIKSACAR